jgi:type I restriction enzyme S subunit
MSPFDEARYARLLEGLDATELMLSTVRHENTKLRLDSAYFAKPMREAERVVRSYRGGHDELGPLFSRFVKGVFDINADSYTDNGIPFLRISNLRLGLIDETNIALIPESRHQDEIKTELRRGDIVFSKTAYPAVSLVTLDRCNTSQDTIATTLSAYGKKTYRPEAIVAFLSSEIGQRLLWRQFQGNVQLHLSLDDGRKVPMPRLGADLQERIAAAFQLAVRAKQGAIMQMEIAETSLLSALDLESGRASEPLTYVRNSSEAFAAGRLDAEFFTPRVRDMLARLGRDGLTIQDVAPVRKERFAPAASGDFDYIEIGGIGADGSAQAESVPQREAPSRATQFVRAGDVITSTVRPIRRLSAVIDSGQDGYVCSSGFVVLQPRAIKPDVLLTYLRLPPVCALMDLHTSASLYPAISETDLLALPIPRIPAATQQSIEKSALAARQARQRATQFLDAGKRAVEIAIEDSEAAALAYLKTRT